MTLEQLAKNGMALLSSLYRDFKDFLSPPACLCCNRGDDLEDSILCRRCMDKMLKENPGAGPICPLCHDQPGMTAACDFCSRESPPRLYYWGRYQEELKRCLIQFKFHGAKELGVKLIDLAGKWLGESMGKSPHDFVIPVPLYHLRQRERGFNQSELLARQLGELLGCPLNQHVLIKIRDTKQQARLEPKDRWANVMDAFSLRNGSRGLVGGKSVLLVDDIVTTGATVFEASKPLLAAGVKRVDIFALAWAG